MSGSDFDLFGDPIVPKQEGRGRPAHQWTKENSNKVNLLFAVGRTMQEVAAALRITLPTLRKHYFSEVKARTAADLRFEAVQLMRLNDQAAEGNIPAIKELNARLDRGRLRGISDSVTGRGKKANADRPLGKKQERVAEAARVAGRYQRRPAPPELIN